MLFGPPLGGKIIPAKCVRDQWSLGPYKVGGWILLVYDTLV